LYGKVVLKKKERGIGLIKSDLPEPISASEVGSLLHGVLFGLEKVLLTRYGVKLQKILPYILDEIEDLLESKSPGILLPDVPMEENLERLRSFFSNTNFFDNVTVEKVDDNTIEFNLGKCTFAKEGVHESLSMEGGSCPIPIIAAAYLLSVVGPEYEIDLSDSTFTDEGSKTRLILVRSGHDSKIE